MRNPERNPYDSAHAELLAQCPVWSPVTVQVRRGDAELRLQEMDEAEAAVLRQEALVAGIEDRTARMQTEHRLNVQYLVRFGVKASERGAFREVLQQVAQDGGLSLYSAAELARFRARFTPGATSAASSDDQRNGTSPSVEVASPGNGSVG